MGCALRHDCWQLGACARYQRSDGVPFQTEASGGRWSTKVWSARPRSVVCRSASTSTSLTTASDSTTNSCWRQIPTQGQSVVNGNSEHRLRHRIPMLVNGKSRASSGLARAAVISRRRCGPFGPSSLCAVRATWSQANAESRSSSSLMCLMIASNHGRDALSPAQCLRQGMKRRTNRGGVTRSSRARIAA